MASKNTKPARTQTQARKNADSGAAVSQAVVVIAKPSIAKGNGVHGNLYDESVKEIVQLSENDSYAKKVDNGPLSEARGKDTWRLHAQLRAADQLSRSLDAHASKLQTALSTLDDHLYANSVAATQLVEQHGSSLASSVQEARETITSAVSATESALSQAVSKAQSAVNRNVTDTTNGLQESVDALKKLVQDSFNKLAKATAGTEENLRTQTDAFSKAVESLLTNVQNDVDSRIMEFRDEVTRQVDKRFNQTDVAFAAVRADQEVIKALLTDIIKDRLGRAEPKVR